MTSPEQPSERERLARVYAEMPDAELEDLAARAFTLTDIAKTALRNEIAGRGMAVTINELAATPSPDPTLVTIRRFRDLPDALLAKSVLESAEIECFLADDIIIRMNWLWSYAMGEIKVRVRDTDAESSDELLKANQEPPALIDFGGTTEYAQPRCPNCTSFDIFHDELTRAAYATLVASLFIIQLLWYPRRRYGWTCHTCGHRWPHD